MSAYTDLRDESIAHFALDETATTTVAANGSGAVGVFTPTANEDAGYHTFATTKYFNGTAETVMDYGEYRVDIRGKMSRGGANQRIVGQGMLKPWMIELSTSGSLILGHRNAAGTGVNTVLLNAANHEEIDVSVYIRSTTDSTQVVDNVDGTHDDTIVTDLHDTYVVVANFALGAASDTTLPCTDLIIRRIATYTSGDVLQHEWNFAIHATEDLFGSNDLVAVGVPTHQGTALRLDNQNPHKVPSRAVYVTPVGYSYIKMGDATTFDAPAEFTLSVWYKCSRICADGSGGVMGKWTYSPSQAGYMMYMGSGKISCYSDGVSTAATTTDARDGDWHHLAVTCDGATGKAYYDGALEGSAGSYGSPSTNTAKMNVGAYLNGAETTPGLYADARVYSRALTLAEITNLADATVASTYLLDDASLEGAWPLEESSVGTHYDISGNGNDGTAMGGIYIDDEADAGYSITLDNGYTKTGAALIPADQSAPTLDVLGAVLSHPTPRLTAGLHANSGSAVRFDGSAQFVNGPAVGLGDVDQSISLWAKTTDVSSHLFSTRDGATGGLSLSIDSGGDLQIVVGAVAETTSATAIDDDAAHHIVVAFDAATDTAYMYLDDALVQTLTPTTGTFTAGGKVLIGARGNTLPAILEPFAGVVDEVMYFDKALTAAEVQHLYQMIISSAQYGYDVYDAIREDIHNAIH
jgi:hypothetical protein